MSQIQKTPTFFIVGALKCGTTAMYTYLRQHPGIYMPRLKEMSFFCDDLENVKKRYPTNESYLSFFKNAKNNQKVGEASALYLMSKTAPFKIKSFCPDAKIVIMLRNPIEVLYSWHSELVFTKYENLDFEEALEAENSRRSGKQFQGDEIVGESRMRWLWYSEVVNFTEQVKLFINIFGNDNVKIIIFDDFKESTLSVYKDVLSFINVDLNFTPDFKVINSNKETKNISFKVFLKNKPIWMSRILRTLIPLNIRITINEKIRLLNTNYVPRKTMDTELKKRLSIKYKSEVDSLGKLLGKDLSHWIT